VDVLGSVHAAAACCLFAAAGRTVPRGVSRPLPASKLMFEDFGATCVGLVFSRFNAYGIGLADNLAAAGDWVLCQLC